MLQLIFQENNNILYKHLRLNQKKLKSLILVGSVATRLPTFVRGEFIGDCIGEPSGDSKPLLNEYRKGEPNLFLKGGPNVFI
ncbi:unnamed protein product [Paramecium octaurelia]|uniref:Uncharacterized protein n=1 Tax=Paramecium octaurelia TaxID=43137 RepID=A0A8S1W194_PAROT|nr:unnamed protein product [Paramecium octaurelia]